MTLKLQVMGGLSWTAGARFLAQIITWAITLIIIRLLSPEDYGLMAIAMVFVSFLSMLSELGLGASIVQRKSLTEQELKTLFGLILILSISFYVLMVVTSPLVASFYNEPRLVALFRALALQFMLMPFIVLPQSILLRAMSFKRIALVDFTSAIVGSLVTLAFALSGYGVWSLVWGTLAIRIASIIGLFVAQPWWLSPSFNMAGVTEFFAFGGYVTASRVLWFIYSNVDALIIGKILGNQLLGLYSVGLQLATLPMEKISGIINQVAFPAFSSVQSDPDLAGQHFLKAVRVMSFFAFPVLWGLSSVAPEIVVVFLGDKWLQSVLPLQIIALIIPVRMISNLMDPAVLGAGRADISFRISVVSFLIMPASFLVGAQWGLLGVSLAWVLAFPLVFFINLSCVVKVYKLSILDVLRSIKRPFLCGLVMFAGVHLLKATLAVGFYIPFKLGLLVFTGALLYLGLVYLVNRRGMNEVVGLLRP